MSTETKTEARNRPMPEIFTRADIRNSGGWDVQRARAVRGEPFISVSGRIMRVPLDDSELAQAIRAHEQIHVKISPQDLTPYISDITGEAAIRAAEEARVNKIGATLGFPMQALMTGSETFEGEMIAQAKDWSQAVFAVAASVHTGSLNPFLTGIRRHAPEWGKPLREISKEIVKFQKTQLKNTKSYVRHSDVLQRYGSTELRENSEILLGMQYTIELAMMLESIAAMPAPEPEATSGGAKGDGAPKVHDRKPVGNDEKQDMEEKSSEKFDRAKVQSEAAKALKSGLSRHGIGEWSPIVVKRLPLTTPVQGALGRKRVASNIGRNPRRVQRLITDPERRIFDKDVKAVGGVVLIDCSGSMSLSREQLRDLMQASPGCTIIAYSNGVGTLNESNTFILGEKGKICSELPQFYHGNGNDLPAVQYANKFRKSYKTPMVWVTDGLVYYGKKYGSSVFSERECAAYVRTHKIHMEYSPAAAVKFLNGLKGGKTYRPRAIQRWEDEYLL